MEKRRIRKGQPKKSISCTASPQTVHFSIIYANRIAEYPVSSASSSISVDSSIELDSIGKKDKAGIGGHQHSPSPSSPPILTSEIIRSGFASPPNPAPSSSESDSFSVESWKYQPFHPHKICLSCKTKKTPRWHKTHFLRKATSDLFCNACAIRIKKYHLLCSSCFYAPTKVQGNQAICPKCKRVFVNRIHEPEQQQKCENQLDAILLGIKQE